MKKYLLLLLSITILIYSCEKRDKKNQKPTLVVGIVVDQMRYDYLTKYVNRYFPLDKTVTKITLLV